MKLQTNSEVTGMAKKVEESNSYLQHVEHYIFFIFLQLVIFKALVDSESTANLRNKTKSALNSSQLAASKLDLKFFFLMP